MDTFIPSLRPSSVGSAPSITEQRQQESAIEQQAEQERPSLGETWEAATQRNFLYKSLNDMGKRNAEKADTNFQMTEERLKPLAQDYDQREMNFIAKAVNENDYHNRISEVGRSRKNLETIQRAGLTGMGLEFAAAMVDPTMLPLMLSTGGLAAAGKAGTLAKMARAFGEGAAISGATEATLMQNDTTRNWSDVLLATVAGGTVSAAVPAVVRAFKGRGEAPASKVTRDNEMWDKAVAVDDELRQAARSAGDADLGDEIQSLVGNPMLTTHEVRQVMSDELAPTAALRMSRGERKPLEQRISELEYSIKKVSDDADEGKTQLTAGGTNKQRKRAAEENARIRAEVEAKAKPLQDELDSIRSRLDEDARYRQDAGDIERLRQGAIPERLKERFETLKAEQEGSLVQAERKSSLEKAEAERAARVSREESESTNLDSDQPNSTAGAAQVQGVKFGDEMHLVGNETSEVWDAIHDGVRLAERAPRNWQMRLYPGKTLKDYAQSAYSTLDQAPSDIIRGLNLKLNANPQAGLKGHIPAAHYQDMYMRRAFNAEGGLEREGALEYAKAKGISAWKFDLGLASAERQEFDNLVVLHMRGKVTSNDPAIQKAAKGRSQMMAQSLRDRKAAGVRGFEEVESDGRYMPFVLDTPKMQAAYRKHGEKAVEDALTGAYKAGRLKLTERAARIIARAQMRRTLDKGLDTQTGTTPIFTSQNIKFLREELETVGLKKDQIDELLEDMENATVNESISKRAKFSLGASISHSEGELRMVDMLNTSQDVALNYAREGAGEAALAKQGLRTRREADTAIDEGVRDVRNLLQAELKEATESGNQKRVDELNELLGSGNKGRLSQYQEMLHDSVKQIMGETLDASDSEWARSGVRLSRATRKITGILRLGWNGFASIPEYSNALVDMGLTTVLRNVPATKWFQVGKYKEKPELEALHSIMGAYAHKENYFMSKNYTAANMGEDASSRMERIYNNLSGMVQDKNMLVSLFRTVQNGGEELAQRSMLDRLMRAANGELKFKASDKKLWSDAGLDDDGFEAVLEYIRNTPESVKVDGKDVRVFSADSMDPELRDKLGAAMTALLGRQMQRNFVGESSVWVNKEVGKIITQFRTFSLVSLEKQLAYGLRGNPLVLAQKIMWSTMMGYLIYNTRVQLQAGNKEDPDEYIQKSTSGAALAIGVMNMNNIYGGLGLQLDAMATVGLLPDSWMAGGKSWGFRGYGVDAVPAAGVVKDSLALTNSGFDMLGSLLMGEGVEEDDSEKAYKKMQRLIPLLNTAAVGTALSVANQE